MDILSHGIYSVALNGSLEKKKLNKKDILVSFLWGTAPDLLSLGPLFIVGILNGSFDHHSPLFGRDYAGAIYPITHSLVIFSLAFLAVYLLRRKIYIPMLGWGLHILTDIPTHSKDFYPTPFLYPLSDYKFLYGVNWRTPVVWMLIWVIGLLWIYLAFRKKKTS